MIECRQTHLTFRFFFFFRNFLVTQTSHQHRNEGRRPKITEQTKNEWSSLTRGAISAAARVASRREVSCRSAPLISAYSRAKSGWTNPTVTQRRLMMRSTLPSSSMHKQLFCFLPPIFFRVQFQMLSKRNIFLFECRFTIHDSCF